MEGALWGAALDPWVLSKLPFSSIVLLSVNWSQKMLWCCGQCQWMQGHLLMCLLFAFCDQSASERKAYVCMEYFAHPEPLKDVY